MCAHMSCGHILYNKFIVYVMSVRYVSVAISGNIQWNWRSERNSDGSNHQLREGNWPNVVRQQLETVKHCGFLVRKVYLQQPHCPTNTKVSTCSPHISFEGWVSPEVLLLVDISLK